MLRKIAITLCSSAIPLSVLASQPWAPISDVTQCRGNLEVVGPCFSLHGAMAIGNGTPGLRIWHVGTKRVLGVVPDEDPIMPDGIRKHLALGVTIYADFELCPFTTRRPGWMQMVCIQSATNVVIQSDGSGSSGPQIKRLKGKFTLAPNHSSKRTRENPRAA